MLVGTEPNQRRFSVHRDIITKRSKFFEAARSERWTKDPSKPVDLKHHEPEIFAMYLHCIYFDQVQETTADYTDIDTVKEAPSGRRQEVADGMFEARVKLYLLADEMQDRPSTNLVINDLARLTASLSLYPSGRAVGLAYASSLEGSPLRRLLVDLTLHDSPILPKGNYPSEYLQDVIAEYHVQKRNVRLGGDRDDIPLLDWTVRDDLRTGRYHQHEDNHPGYEKVSRCSQRNGKKRNDKKRSGKKRKNSMSVRRIPASQT